MKWQFLECYEKYVHDNERSDDIFFAMKNIECAMHAPKSNKAAGDDSRLQSIWLAQWRAPEVYILSK